MIRAFQTLLFCLLFIPALALSTPTSLPSAPTPSSPAALPPAKMPTNSAKTPANPASNSKAEAEIVDFSKTAGDTQWDRPYLLLGYFLAFFVISSYLGLVIRRFRRAEDELLHLSRRLDRIEEDAASDR